MLDRETDLTGKRICPTDEEGNPEGDASVVIGRIQGDNGSTFLILERDDVSGIGYLVAEGTVRDNYVEAEEAETDSTDVTEVSNDVH